MSVTVIGWLFVGFGALALLGGVFGAIVSLSFPFPDEPAAKMADAPLPFQVMSRLFGYFWLLAAVQIVVAIAMIWSGAAFLRLRPWGRTVIEGITRMALVYNLAFGAFWIWLVAAMWSEAPAGADAATIVFPVFISFGAVMIAAFSVPMVVILRVLRGRTVRDALGRAHSGAVPIAFLILLACLTGCTDNAVRMRFGMEAAVKRLQSSPDRGESRFTYRPAGSLTVPYWLIFLPRRPIVAADLVDRGLPATVADQIMRELAYVNVGRGPLLVVQQEGQRLAFTRYDGELPIVVDDLIVARRTGECEVLLRREGTAVHIAGIL